MKRCFVLTFTLIFCLLFIGCGQQNDREKSTVQATAIDSDFDPDCFNGEPFTYDRLSLYLPTDFTVEEDGQFTVATSANHCDMITFAKTGKDDAGQYSRDVLEKYFKSVFPQFGESVDFRFVTVDGVETICYRFTATVDEMPLTLTQYMIFGDDFTDLVTFTDASGLYSEDYETLVHSIRVAK